ncbi:MAG: HAD-IIIA family hydrolase [Desulfovibrionaceae bacterium]|nr:HAD-IIIA family hydrolase [Desulfovibrionaceae bacterium]
MQRSSIRQDCPPLFRNILLDRDGTVIEERHYLHDPDQVSLIYGVGAAMANLAQKGCHLFLVSNQSGIGRGFFTSEDVQSCQNRLTQLLHVCGAEFDDALWCPHAPEANCQCRKPRPGMWQTLREKHSLNPAESCMIGDKIDDLRFASACNLFGVLVLTGHGMKEARQNNLPLPQQGEIMLLPQKKCAVAPDLVIAASFILGQISSEKIYLAEAAEFLL